MGHAMFAPTAGVGWRGAETGNFITLDVAFRQYYKDIITKIETSDCGMLDDCLKVSYV
jgi:hypothetical protein